MSLLDLLNHFLNLFAPALGVALGLAVGARWLVRRPSDAMPWWKQVLVIAAVGALLLLLGLMLTGRDARMGTYIALVLGCATTQWILLRGWRR